MIPFDAYVMYLACKMHFNSPSYDYFKYNGKVRANAQKFDTRRDKYFYYKLSKKDDLLNYYAATLSENPDTWVDALLSEKGEKNYAEWKQRQESFTYRFGLETQDLYPDFDSLVVVEGGQHPMLYKHYRQNAISKETLIVLDEIYNIFEYWNSNIEDVILWPKDFMLLQKYKPFIRYDVKKCKNILKKHINQYK